MSNPLVVLAAGGTGGHVFPAEALAEALLGRGRRLALVTDIATRNYGGTLGKIETHALGLRRMGDGVISRVLGLASVATAVPRARRLIDSLAPAVVVGFGGYPSLPTLFAAARAGVPTLLHEQNAVLGRANRLLAGHVRRIATSFASVARAPRGAVTDYVGNPVRPAIRALRNVGYPAPVSGQPFHLLVVGGSQGARAFSDVIPAALARLDEDDRRRLRITHQARPEDAARAKAAYVAAGIDAEVETFFADIGQRMVRAHVVICRAGASTCAEIACIGRPALFVPYPFATDDHQTANARALAAAGGGWVLGQAGFTAAALAERVRGWMSDATPLIAAAAAAHSLGRPEAAERLADIVDALMPANGNSLEKAA
ncbi:MAG: undecaprenyldiphospho-muramoylpentapeptide beta-N-acetylglucosaminyltransferase [Alphaproteobacteria bacterium]|nr:undecaprenyldiphospho-muramoylpentapeptide beta-N-acetylglucosaminyltransferase [Alphaproteobacteria bacterium]